MQVLHYSNYSTYAGIIMWGVVSFGITPTFGAFMVHFLLTPLVIYGVVALCHWEGRNQMLPEIEALKSQLATLRSAVNLPH